MMIHFNEEECKQLNINKDSTINCQLVIYDQDGGASLDVSLNKKKRFNPIERIKSLFK